MSTIARLILTSLKQEVIYMGRVWTGQALHITYKENQAGVRTCYLLDVSTKRGSNPQRVSQLNNGLRDGVMLFGTEVHLIVEISVLK